MSRPPPVIMRPPPPPRPVFAAPPAQPSPKALNLNPYKEKLAALGDVQVRRLTEADIEPVLTWVAPRLRIDHPALNDANLVLDCRFSMTDRHSCLIASANVCGLFRCQYSSLSGRPQVWEEWLRSRSDAIAEGGEPVFVYRAAQAWAKAINAERLTVFWDTDAVGEIYAAAFPTSEQDFYWALDMR